MADGRDRPVKRVYVWMPQWVNADGTIGAHIDQRIVEARGLRPSKQDGQIYRARTYHNMGPTPMYIDSYRKFKDTCKRLNVIPAG